MLYIYGIILSVLIGLSNSIVKELTTKIKTSKYLLISSWFNLIGTLMIYFIFLYRKDSNVIFDIKNLTQNAIFILIIYFLFRIFSNVSQTKLNSYKDVNVNVLNIVLSCMFFLTIAIDSIMGISYGATIIIGFVVSLIGMLIITVDFKKLKFCFNRKEIFLLIVAYICSGTKPVMAKYLLNFIPLPLLAVLECLNYALIYTLYNNKRIFDNEGINKTILKQLILHSIICVICVFTQFKVIIDIKIYILTSFTTPIFTAIFAYLINKQYINKKTIIGIFIIVIGICIAKLSM
ncbi:MAG: EamA family transporter [Clostridia bacterium]|nr:EamA family transporter [Clostridia bacterium]